MKTKKSILGKRFIAFFIDWYISSLFASIPVIVMQSIQARDLVIINRLDNLSLPYAWMGGILALAVYTAYYCIIPILRRKNWELGQTPGRQLMKIKLIKTDGSSLELKNLLIRDFLCVLLLQGYLTSSNIYIMSLIQITANLYIVPYFQSFYYVTVTVSLLMMLFSKKRQMLHDFLSKIEMIEISH
ncbi:MAG: RDD family protein [Eubacteriales bacterium]